VPLVASRLVLEWKKKTMGDSTNGRFRLFQKLFSKEKQKLTAVQKKKSCKEGGRNPPLQRTSETAAAAAATECNQQFQQLTTAGPSS
jgi:hypothetical protein